MKNIKQFIAHILWVSMLINIVPMDCFATEINFSQVTQYSIPLVSSEIQSDSIIIYEVNNRYFLDVEDIASLTRFEYEEGKNEFILTQGARKITILTKNGELTDSLLGLTAVEQGSILFYHYDDHFLCEAIPLLTYLGAESSVDIDTGYFQVLMPELTFWEAYMPQYEQYCFNSERWLGSDASSDGEITPSLVCDIIMDFFDITNGHGVDLRVHNEDALYDVLDVNIYSYDSVSDLTEANIRRIDCFLNNAIVSNVISQGSAIGTKLYDAYAEYILGAKISTLDVQQTYEYLQKNCSSAAEIGQEINKEVNNQLFLITEGEKAVTAATIALDVAYNTYKMMCYDEDSRLLFASCINDEVESYTNYSFEIFGESARKISQDLENDQSIVKKAAVDAVTNWAIGEAKDKGIEFVASVLAEGDIYGLAAQLAVVLAEIPLRKSIDAFSDDMDMILLARFQTEILDCSYPYINNAIVNEKASDVNHLNTLKMIMGLYYRTTIAFCENAIVSIEEFGTKSSKDNNISYLKNVANYMAAYLYCMTNCEIVPIVQYSDLNDNVFSREVITAIGTKRANTIDIVDYYGKWPEFIKILKISETSDIGVNKYSSKKLSINFIDDIYENYIIDNTGDEKVSAYGIKIGQKYPSSLGFLSQYGSYIVNDYADGEKYIYLWDEIGQHGLIELRLFLNSDETITQWTVNNWPEGYTVGFYYATLEKCHEMGIRDLEGWQRAYLNSVSEDFDMLDECPDIYYQLIDINNDDIPELYVDYNQTAGGAKIITFDGKKVIEQLIYSYGLSYIPRKGLFRDSGGHMGEYYDTIYSISNSSFKEVAHGEYHETSGFSDNKNPVYEYTWNNADVNKSEYDARLKAVFDIDQAVNPFSEEYDWDTGIYDGFCFLWDIGVEIVSYTQ